MESDDVNADAIEAATFRRLLNHLDARKDAQNIELMLLAGFCRNCLSKWYRDEAEARGHQMSQDEARARIYGMPYSEWKARHQCEATPEQLAQFKALKSE